MDKRCTKNCLRVLLVLYWARKRSIRCNSTSLPINCNIDYNNILIIKGIIWTNVVSKNCLRVLLVLYWVRKWSIRCNSTSLPTTCNIDYNKILIIEDIIWTKVESAVGVVLSEAMVN